MEPNNNVYPPSQPQSAVDDNATPDRPACLTSWTVPAYMEDDLRSKFTPMGDTWAVNPYDLVRYLAWRHRLHVLLSNVKVPLTVQALDYVAEFDLVLLE
jgi:hypothetical protein